MKKVVRIFTMLSVLAMSCVLICCSGGGSSSDDEDVAVESTPETLAVSTTETPTVTTIISLPENCLARVEYTARAGENMEDEHKARIGYSLTEDHIYAIPWDPYIIPERVSVDSSTNPPTARFWLKAYEGYYIFNTNPVQTCPLPAGINGNNLVVDETTNCWTFRE